MATVGTKSSKRFMHCRYCSVKWHVLECALEVAPLTAAWIGLSAALAVLLILCGLVAGRDGSTAGLKFRSKSGSSTEDCPI